MYQRNFYFGKIRDSDQRFTDKKKPIQDKNWELKREMYHWAWFFMFAMLCAVVFLARRNCKIPNKNETFFM